MFLSRYNPQNTVKTHKEQTSDLHGVLRKFKLHVSAWSYTKLRILLGLIQLKAILITSKSITGAYERSRVSISWFCMHETLFYIQISFPLYGTLFLGIVCVSDLHDWRYFLCIMLRKLFCDAMSGLCKLWMTFLIGIIPITQLRFYVQNVERLADQFSLRFMFTRGLPRC